MSWSFLSLNLPLLRSTLQLSMNGICGRSRYTSNVLFDLIIRRGWYETTEFWTPKAYRTIIAPTLKKEAELVHQAGKKFGYIITSAFMPILDDILDAGVDVLIGLDPKEGKGTDLLSVKEKFKAKNKCIWGGVSGPLTVEQGTEQETEEAVIHAMQTLGKGGQFILSQLDHVGRCQCLEKYL